MAGRVLEGAVALVQAPKSANYCKALGTQDSPLPASSC